MALVKTINSSSWKRKPRIREKKFFWKDKTGRGYTNTFNQAQLKKTFKGETSWHGVSAYYFSLNAEIGDKWESGEHEVIRTQ